MKVLLYPSKLLRQTTLPVKDHKKEEKTIHKMKDLMVKYKGIGLAAPQIGLLKKYFIMDFNDKIIECINPKILHSSSELFVYEEGCLSIPGVRSDISRPKVIDVEYEDLSGKTIKNTFTDLNSTCFQHELDHLNGVLFFDYLKIPKKIQLLTDYSFFS